MWFSYCSFGLLTSALLFFVWIGGLRFSSPLVNRVARSSLAIYLLHGAPLVALHVIAPFVVRYVCPLGGRGAVLGALLPLTLGIIAAYVAQTTSSHPSGGPSTASAAVSGRAGSAWAAPISADRRRPKARSGSSAAARDTRPADSSAASPFFATNYNSYRSRCFPPRSPSALQPAAAGRFLRKRGRRSEIFPTFVCKSKTREKIWNLKEPFTK